MKIVIVGGTWNGDGGKPSKLLGKLGAQCAIRGWDLVLQNGGRTSDLRGHLEALEGSQAVVWMPNV